MTNEEYYELCEQDAADEARAEREFQRRRQRRENEEPICNMGEDEASDD